MKNLFGDVAKEASKSLGRALKPVKEFGREVKKIFYDVWDAVVGHSYWPDTINGVIDYAKNIGKAEGPLTKFRKSAIKIFQDISKSVAGYAKTVGGPVTAFQVKLSQVDFKGFFDALRARAAASMLAGLMIVFGTPNLKVAGIAFFASLFNDSLNKAFSVFLPSFVKLAGYAAGEFASHLVAGVITGLDTILAAIPSFVSGMLASLGPMGEFISRLITGSATFGNTLLQGIVAAGAVIAAMHASWGKQGLFELFFGKEGKEGKDGKMKKAPTDGIMDFIGGFITKNSRGPAKGQGYLTQVFGDRKGIAAAAALSIGAALLDSVTLVEALSIGTPLMLFAILGKDGGVKATKQGINAVRLMMLAAYKEGVKVISAVTGNNSIVMALANAPARAFSTFQRKGKSNDGQLQSARFATAAFMKALAQLPVNLHKNAKKYTDGDMGFLEAALTFPTGKADVLVKNWKRMAKRIAAIKFGTGPALGASWKQFTDGGTALLAALALSYRKGLTAIGSHMTLMSAKTGLLMNTSWMHFYTMFSKGTFSIIHWLTRYKVILIGIFALWAGTAAAADTGNEGVNTLGDNLKYVVGGVAALTAGLYGLGVAMKVLESFKAGRENYVESAIQDKLKDVAAGLAVEKATKLAGFDQRNKPTKGRRNAGYSIARDQFELAIDTQIADKLRDHAERMRRSGTGFAGSIKGGFEAVARSAANFGKSLTDVTRTKLFNGAWWKSGFDSMKGFFLGIGAQVARLILQLKTMKTLKDATNDSGKGSGGFNLLDMIPGMGRKGKIGGAAKKATAAAGGRMRDAATGRFVAAGATGAVSAAGVGEAAGVAASAAGMMSGLSGTMTTIATALGVTLGGLAAIAGIVTGVIVGAGALALWLFGPGDSFKENLGWAYDKIRSMFGLAPVTAGGRKVAVDKILKGTEKLGDNEYSLKESVNRISFSQGNMSKEQQEVVTEAANNFADTMKNLRKASIKQGFVTTAQYEEAAKAKLEFEDIAMRQTARGGMEIPEQQAEIKRLYTGVDNTFGEMLKRVLRIDPIRTQKDLDNAKARGLLEDTLKFFKAAGKLLFGWVPVFIAGTAKWLSDVGKTVTDVVVKVGKAIGIGAMALFKSTFFGAATTAFLKPAIVKPSAESVSKAKGINDLLERYAAVKDSLRPEDQEIGKKGVSRLILAKEQSNNAIKDGKQIGETLAEFQKRESAAMTELARAEADFEKLTKMLIEKAMNNEKILVFTAAIKGVADEAKKLLDLDLGENAIDFLGSEKDFKYIKDTTQAVKALERQYAETWDYVSRQQISIEIKVKKLEANKIAEEVEKFAIAATRQQAILDATGGLYNSNAMNQMNQGDMEKYVRLMKEADALTEKGNQAAAKAEALQKAYSDAAAARRREAAKAEAENNEMSQKAHLKMADRAQAKADKAGKAATEARSLFAAQAEVKQKEARAIPTGELQKFIDLMYQSAQATAKADSAANDYQRTLLLGEAQAKRMQAEKFKPAFFDIEAVNSKLASQSLDPISIQAYIAANPEEIFKLTDLLNQAAAEQENLRNLAKGTNVDAYKSGLEKSLNTILRIKAEQASLNAGAIRAVIEDKKLSPTEKGVAVSELGVSGFDNKVLGGPDVNINKRLGLVGRKATYEAKTLAYRAQGVESPQWHKDGLKLMYRDMAALDSQLEAMDSKAEGTAFKFKDLMGVLNETGMAVSDLGFARLDEEARKALTTIGKKLNGINKIIEKSGPGADLLVTLEKRAQLYTEARALLIQAINSDGATAMEALSAAGISDMKFLSELSGETFKDVVKAYADVQTAKDKLNKGKGFTQAAAKEVYDAEMKLKKLVDKVNQGYAERLSFVNDIFDTDFTESEFAMLPGSMVDDWIKAGTEIRAQIASLDIDGISNDGRTAKELYKALREQFTDPGQLYKIFLESGRALEEALTRGGKSAFDKVTDTFSKLDLSFGEFMTIPKEQRRKLSQEATSLDALRELSDRDLPEDIAKIIEKFNGNNATEILSEIKATAFGKEFATGTDKIVASIDRLPGFFKSVGEGIEGAIRGEPKKVVDAAGTALGDSSTVDRVEVFGDKAGLGIPQTLMPKREVDGGTQVKLANASESLNAEKLAFDSALDARQKAKVAVNGERGWNDDTLMSAGKKDLERYNKLAETTRALYIARDAAFAKGLDTTVLQGQINNYRAAMEQIPRLIEENAEMVNEAGKNIAGGFHESITSGLKEVLKGKMKPEDFIMDVLDKLTSNLIDTFVDGLMKNITGEGSGIYSFMDKIGRMMGSGSQSLGQKAGDQISPIANIGADLVNSFMPASQQTPAQGENPLGGIATSMIGAFAPKGGIAPPEAGSNMVSSGMTNLAGSIGEYFPKVEETFSEVGHSIDSLSGAAPAAGAGGGGMGTGFWGMIGSLLGMAIGSAYAGGGEISGPGTGTSDSILAQVSNGEFVVRAKAAQRNLPLLHAINKGQLPKFALGGEIGNSTMTGTPSMASLSLVKPSSSNGKGQTVVNLNVTGDVSRQTRKEIMSMIPQIASGVNTENRERGQ
jgi:hypothetical protein